MPAFLGIFVTCPSFSLGASDLRFKDGQTRPLLFANSCQDVKLPDVDFLFQALTPMLNSETATQLAFVFRASVLSMLSMLKLHG